MFNPKGMSAAIRMKKKARLAPDMDYAGQDALQPTTADEIKQNLEVSNALEDAGVEGMDHEPASPKEMGEGDSTQDVKDLKKISARIAKYFDSL
jgi:uncharacterized protein (DUF1501 family)